MADSLTLARSLRQFMEDRNLDAAYSLLKESRSCSAGELRRDDYRLLYELSRWISMWAPAASLVSAELKGASIGRKRGVTLLGFVHFKIAQAFYELSQFDSDGPERGRDLLAAAKAAVDQVVALRESIDPYLVASAFYCRGRALTLESNPSDALEAMENASGLFKELGQQRLAAVADLQLHRLYLELPESYQFSDAKKLLDEAEVQLAPSGDLLNKAFVQYLRGRNSRFGGAYEKAARHFGEAVKLYFKEGEYHGGKPRRTILRALQGQARSLRLQASTLALSVAKRDFLLDEAEQLLSRADDLSNRLNANTHDKAKIWIGKAYLALDRDAIGSVLSQTEEIRRRCAGYDNDVIWSRLHLLRFKAYFGSLDLGRAKRLAEARKEASLALEFANKTSHRRIRARAEIANGHIALVDLPGPGGIHKAGGHERKAKLLLQPEDQDYLRKELEALSAELDGSQQTVRWERPIHELKDKKVNQIVNREIKPEIIRKTQHFYTSVADMRKKNGISQGLIENFAIDGNWKKRASSREQDDK